MVTLRATAAILKRLGIKPAAEPPASTTLLGDWYLALNRLSRDRRVMAVSAVTLLPVLLLARGLRSLPQRLPDAVAEMLLALGIPTAAVRTEVDAMRETTIAATASRRILGTMNDFQFMSTRAVGLPVVTIEVALFLARSPCRPIGMRRPDDMTREMFGLPPMTTRR